MQKLLILSAGHLGSLDVRGAAVIWDRRGLDGRPSRSAVECRCMWEHPPLHLHDLEEKLLVGWPGV